MNWLTWALLSAFFAALTAILAKIGVTGINPNLATAIRTTVVVILTWGVASLTSSRTDWNALSPRTWAFLAASGFATGLSWLCYFRALQLGEVSKVAPIDKLSVVLALVLAAIFLGERMRPVEMLGAGLIVAGALILVLK
jgi:transporter family protein